MLQVSRARNRRSFEQVCLTVLFAVGSVVKLVCEVLPMEGPENHRSQKKDTKAVENLSVNLTRPQDLSRWEHLNGVQSPEIDEKVTLRIGANVSEAQVHEDVLIGRAGEPYAVRTAFGPW